VRHCHTLVGGRDESDSARPGNCTNSHSSMSGRPLGHAFSARSNSYTYLDRSRLQLATGPPARAASLLACLEPVDRQLRAFYDACLEWCLRGPANSPSPHVLQQGLPSPIRPVLDAAVSSALGLLCEDCHGGSEVAAAALEALLTTLQEVPRDQHFRHGFSV